MSRGWISIHRSMRDHWIFDDAERLKAWLIILMEVNHKSNKTLIKGKLLSCERGESLYSHDSWAQKFGKKWNRAKVIRFFKLLESDQMIETKNVQVTTHLKVNNYGQYQDLDKTDRTPNSTPNDTVDEQQADTKRTPDSTQPNNVNNGNNDNKKDTAQAPEFNFKNSFLSLGVDKTILNDWMKVRTRKKSSNTETAFNAIKNQINKSGLSANDAIKISAEKSWAGFDSEWLKKSSSNKPNLQTVKDQFLGAANA